MTTTIQPSGGSVQRNVTLEQALLPRYNGPVILQFARPRCVDHHRAYQTLSSDRGGTEAHDCTPRLLATLASAFLALGHHHENLPLESNARSLRSRSRGLTPQRRNQKMIGRAGDHPLETRQFRRQRRRPDVASPFLAGSPGHRSRGTLRLHFGRCFTPRFQLRNSSCSVVSSSCPGPSIWSVQPQPLFRYLDL